MIRPISIYLDAVRLSAALVVLVAHLSGRRFSGGLFWQVARFQDDAVTVFFVLSGFVIAHVAATREQDAAGFAAARAGRIYSVALPALALAAVLDMLGSSLRPDLYPASVEDAAAYWGGLLAGAAFVNEVWFLSVPVGSMVPYWSLGFEVWYYVAFGLVLFLPRRWRVPALVALLLLVGPRIAALLPLWLLGAWLWRRCDRNPPGERAGWLLCLGAVVAYLAYDRWGRPDIAPGFGAGGLAMAELASRYAVGLLFAAHLLGMRAVAHRFAGPLERIARPVRWVAGATFSLYLYHLPLALFLAASLPWPAASWQMRVALFLGVPAMSLALAEVTERRKEPWRRAFAGLLSRAGAQPRVASGGEGR